MIASLFLVSRGIMGYGKKSFLRLDKSITEVFAGDSNIECDVNDSLIPNSINIASSGEPYIYTFFKLKGLLEVNPQIKRVFVGCGFHDFDLKVENRWMYEDAFLIHNFESDGYLLDTRAYWTLLSHNPKAFTLGVRNATLFDFRGIFRCLFPSKRDIRHFEFGGYLYLNTSKLEEDRKRMFEDINNYHMCRIQRRYLESIADLCRMRGIKLSLLNTPKHSIYRSNITDDMVSNWKTLSKTVGGEIWDYSAYDLPDSCFADLTHLNNRGAEAFSRSIYERITPANRN